MSNSLPLLHVSSLCDAAYLQIVTSLVLTLNLPLPSVFRDFLNAFMVRECLLSPFLTLALFASLQFVNADFLKLTSASCVVKCELIMLDFSCVDRRHRADTTSGRSTR